MQNCDLQSKVNTKLITHGTSFTMNENEMSLLSVLRVTRPLWSDNTAAFASANQLFNPAARLIRISHCSVVLHKHSSVNNSQSHPCCERGHILWFRRGWWLLVCLAAWLAAVLIELIAAALKFLLSVMLVTDRFLTFLLGNAVSDLISLLLWGF